MSAKIFIEDQSGHVEEYPVDTAEEIELAQLAMKEAGIRETPVYTGDPPDQIRTFWILFDE